MTASPPVIVFDMGGTRVRVGLVDDRGSVLARIIEPTRSEEGPDRLADRIVALSNSLLANGGFVGTLGVGAALAGPLDRDGVLYDPPNLIGWRTVPFKSMLEARFQAPVWVGNDANLACLGEQAFGQAQGLQDVIYLTVSTGVGGGVISGGQLITGWRGMGAEVGHIIIDMDGPLGRCGHQGCLESHVSGTAIVSRARAAIAAGRASTLSSHGRLDEMGANHVFQAAARGDAFSQDLVHSVAREMGAGIVSLVHVFNPRMVILGGGVLQSWAMLEDTVRQSIQERTFRGFLDGLTVAVSAYGDDIGLMGAAALVLRETRRP